MRPEQLAELPEYYGLYFDPETGKTYREDGTDTGFTFERARWTGPFGLHFSWPWLNPIAFATYETAAKVKDVVARYLPPLTTAEIDETQRVVGPFTRTVERKIRISTGGRAESFSAGLIANSIIRNGEKRAMESLLAEWRLVPGRD